MQRRPSPRAPRPHAPPDRAEFDRVFDRYADALWAALEPRAEAAAVAEEVERILTRIVLRWSEGEREPALDLLALELVRSAEKELLEEAEGSSEDEVAS